jgi:hypothetical protein
VRAFPLFFLACLSTVYAGSDEVLRKMPYQMELRPPDKIEKVTFL